MAVSGDGNGPFDAVGVALGALVALGERAVEGGPLGALTTYRVGGAAAVMATVHSLEDLAHLAEAARVSALPVLVVGRGSNLLVSDRGFAGLAVVLDSGGFGTVSIDGSTVRAGATVALPSLARQTVEAGLTGLEWAVGVPGSVGGGIRMNAGGHGSDMSRSMLSCSVVDLSRPGAPVETRDRAAMRYSYRHSSIGPSEIVVSATFELSPGDAEQGLRTIRQIVRWRREHQPGGQNAGSVFTNPPGDSAGRLIDSTGLKGRRWRTAMVSLKHANFIQADPGGSADDVYELIKQVRAEVEAAHGVTLVPEVHLVGFAAEPSTSTRDRESEEGTSGLD